jgi:hypothetical protein
MIDASLKAGIKTEMWTDASAECSVVTTARYYADRQPAPASDAVSVWRDVAAPITTAKRRR